MRTAPLALAISDPDQLLDAAIAESAITHADPRCLLACAVFDLAIAAAIAGRDPVAAAAAALQPARDRARELFGSDAADQEALDRAYADITTDIVAASAGDPRVYTSELNVHRTAGFVRVALRLALWHASRTASWHAALIDVASRGGDADTNAAIVGALLGARDGEDAIPIAWRERVLAATLPGPRDWAEAHHPRHLLALA